MTTEVTVKNRGPYVVHVVESYGPRNPGAAIVHELTEVGGEVTVHIWDAKSLLVFEPQPAEYARAPVNKDMDAVDPRPDSGAYDPLAGCGAPVMLQ